MILSGKMNAAYEEDLDVTTVEVPYEKDELSIIFMLPGKISEFVVDGLNRIEKVLDANSWENLLKSFVPQSMDLKVPLLNSHCLLNLNETLISLGLNDSFSNEADFSGMNGADDLKISSFLQVNELSFETTDSLYNKRSAKNTFVDDKVYSFIKRKIRQQNVYELTLERQFMYIVRHNPTGLILYIGRYHHPDENKL